MEKDKREKYSKYLLIWGTLIMIIAPFFFTFVFKTSLINSGQIGDTIGGITSPIVSLIGAILVYYALSAQIDSNKILAIQIEEAKAKEQKAKEEQHVFQLYNFFSDNISNFTFEDKEEHLKGEPDPSLIIYNGSIALDHFVDFLQKQKIDSHDKEKILENRNTREFISIIKSADLLIDALKQASLDIEDKKFYKNLIDHQLTYKISPNFDSISLYGKKLEMCQCGMEHGTFPAFILELLINIKEKLKTV